MRLQADLINGVTEVKEFEDGVDIFNDETMFWEQLSQPFDGVIGCDVSEYILV